MLLKAEVKSEKFIATHAQRVDGIANYCHELSKDPSNGFTKDRTMRRIGSIPYSTLMIYEGKHPGFLQKIMNPVDHAEKERAWTKFLNSDDAKPFLMVEKLLHA